MLVLFMLAFCAGLAAAFARRTPLVRTLAVPIAVLSIVLMSTAAPVAVAGSAAIVVAAVAVSVVLDVDVRYNLSKIAPLPFNSTYRLLDATGSWVYERATWVQWRGHVMRHRSHALA